jgi:hypothetical protein
MLNVKFEIDWLPILLFALLLLYLVFSDVNRVGPY